MRNVAPSVAIAIAIFSVIDSNGAAPRPTTRPAGQDTTEFRADPFGITFRVPKSWKRLESSGDPNAIFVFDTAPATKKPTPSRTPPRIQPPRYFHLYFGQPCERQKQLAEVVKDTRHGIQNMNPGVTFRKDDATDLAGRQAWTFSWPEKKTVTLHEVRNGKTTDHPITFDVWRQKTLWLQNDTICEYGMEADPASFPAMEKLAAQVHNSLEWSDPAKPTGPN